jgi:hypothetical protein
MGAPSAASNLIPVDHDPFADTAGSASNLIPVDYDPFGGGDSVAPSLVPVDHDPFADARSALNLLPVDHDPFAAHAPADASQFGSTPQSDFADTVVSNPVSTPSPDQPAPPDQLAGSSPLPPGGSYLTPSRPPSLAKPGPFSPNNLPASLWPARAPTFPNSPRAFSVLENAPPSGAGFDPTRSLLGLIPQMQPARMSLVALASAEPASPAPTVGNDMSVSSPPKISTSLEPVTPQTLPGGTGDASSASNVAGRNC